MVEITSVTATYGSNSYDRIRAGKKQVTGDAGGAQSANVEISGVSSQLQKMRAAITAAPMIRQNLVDSIKIRIKNNDYPIENNLNEALKRLIQSHIVP